MVLVAGATLSYWIINNSCTLINTTIHLKYTQQYTEKGVADNLAYSA
jgi:hypothetical protein